MRGLASTPSWAVIFMLSFICRWSCPLASGQMAWFVRGDLSLAAVVLQCIGADTLFSDGVFRGKAQAWLGQ